MGMFSIGYFTKMWNTTWKRFLQGEKSLRTRVFSENSLDAGIQDSSTSISIVVKFEQRLLKKEMVMKVTNMFKLEIVDTHS